ncbi:MAG: phosphotransferase family protein [Lactobacillus sp.]|jgi:thiamine kinase-like enzyme|nr:phosphotransferase family protein [Lactobacillus sp.]
MTFGLSQDWEIESAGGSTGNAFIGISTQHDTKKIFLKRNTSPFLAALSAEEITPKLLWTKRLPSGDVITAQQWVDGWTLTKSDVQSQRTAQLLAKVHSSNLLKSMLEKIGGSFVTPDQMLQQLSTSLPGKAKRSGAIATGLRWLENHTLQVPVSSYRVCHGDLNKKNWLQTRGGNLFLVDWDQAMLTDPAYDLTTVLLNYIPFGKWSWWLSAYGLTLDSALLQRIQWFAILQQVAQGCAQSTAKDVAVMQQTIASLTKMINVND